MGGSSRTIYLGSIEDNNTYNPIASVELPDQWFNDQGGQLPSAYMKKDDKLVFSWIVQQDTGSDPNQPREYYRTLFIYDFAGDTWSQGELTYISPHNLSVPVVEKSDMEYFPNDLLHMTTINVPEDFATIQEAIDYSVDGDSILVSPGTYNESLF